MSEKEVDDKEEPAGAFESREKYSCGWRRMDRKFAILLPRSELSLLSDVVSGGR